MLVDATTNAAILPPRVALRNCFHIGGVALALSGDSAESIRLSPELTPFVDNSHSADIEVTASFVEDLPPGLKVPVFDSGAVWRVSCTADGFTFDFVSEALGRNPYKRLLTSHDFSSARLMLNNNLLGARGPIFPLEYPADELLVTNYLASHRFGIEVHGCGLIDLVAGGQLFLGHSGAGKSTTTRVWETFRDAQVLSDDRIILRLHEGKLWMYGTPWHGEAAFASPGKARLNRIFILQHGSSNRVRLLPKAQAAGELFARSFPPFHSAAGLDRVLEFIGRTLEAIPCYEFQFVPDQSAVKAVLEFDD